MTVFIADHDKGFLEMVKGHLSSQGMNVVTFQKGDELIETLEVAARERREPGRTAIKAAAKKMNRARTAGATDPGEPLSVARGRAWIETTVIWERSEADAKVLGLFVGCLSCRVRLRRRPEKGRGAG